MMHSPDEPCDCGDRFMEVHWPGGIPAPLALPTVDRDEDRPSPILAHPARFTSAPDEDPYA